MMLGRSQGFLSFVSSGLECSPLLFLKSKWSSNKTGLESFKPGFASHFQFNGMVHGCQNQWQAIPESHLV